MEVRLSDSTFPSSQEKILNLESSTVKPSRGRPKKAVQEEDTSDSGGIEDDGVISIPKLKQSADVEQIEDTTRGSDSRVTIKAEKSDGTIKKEIKEEST